MSNADKYVAMIQAMERHHEYQAVSHSEPGAREAYLANASDWRAMREAWQAMENVCELVSYGVYSEPDNCLAEAEAALAKARGE